MPWIIIIYFSIQLCIRLLISSNLEVDDSEMVGQIHWALGYSNSHPPLYHWIVRICYDLFGYWPAATAVPKCLLLTVAFLLIYDAARRVTESTIAGAVAVVFFFLIPTIFWRSQAKMTHSILGVAATAATLQALVLVLRRPRASAFAWLGLALSIGLLAKYNFVFVIIALAIAVLCVPDVRRIFAQRAALLAIVIPVVLSLPHWLWVRSHLDLALQNLYLLRVPGGPLPLPMSERSIWKGLWTLAVTIVLSLAPTLLVCVGALSLFRSGRTIEKSEPASARQMQRVLGWMLLAELAVFAVAVVAGKFYQVHERYLVVLLPPFPLWLLLRSRAYQRTKSTAAILFVGLWIAVVMTVLRPLSVFTGHSRLAFPWAEIAHDVAKVAGPATQIVSDHREFSVNTAIRVSSLASADEPTATQVILIARDPTSVSRLGKRFSNYMPAGEMRTIEARLHGRSDRIAKLAVQRWQQRGDRH